jgi:hypothetical protein
VNDRECRRVFRIVTPSWSRIARYACCLALLGSPACALAQLAVTATADTQYEYNSNVFDLQSGFPVPGLGGSGLSDSFIAYGAKLDATYLWSQQQFHALVLGNEYHYDRFSQLSHNEYTLDGGWNWKLGRLLDGLLEASRTRTMVSIYDLIETSQKLQLAVQTEQRETAKIGLQATPDWRAEASGYTRKIEAPIVGEPDLSVTETSGAGAFKYTGTAGATAGLSVGYLQGAFKGTMVNGVAAPNPAYHETDFGLTATDIVTGKSTFLGRVGYSRRTSTGDANAAADSLSGVTGELNYLRALTAKTTMDLDLSRQINVYVTGNGSEIDNVAALTFNWQATYKIGVALGYSWTDRQLPGQGDGGADRTDRLNYISLAIDYEAFPWLSLKPYVHYQDRSATNFAGGNFNATVVGVTFALQLQHGVIPPPTPFQIGTTP